MILKKGDNNEIVKKIQAVLGVEQVGNFGDKTEKAVKEWQTKNGLVADGIVGDKTLAKMGIVIAPTTTSASLPTNTSASIPKVGAYNKDMIEKGVKSKGYKWFDEKDMLLNIVGVRNSSVGQKVTNAFDDKLTLSYKENGVWKYKEWTNTTDAGKKGVLEYHNPNGVARLVEGQYIGSHAIGLHQGKYEALRQVKAVKVFRDANKDMMFDEKTIQEGIFGINIHKAGVDSTYVENWSEGCQVFKKASDFEEFMAIARKSKAVHGNSFTYTLINSNDLV
jgi:peptidoglycan hydrolase-like protein with peptidoglycan-binding domain